MSCYWYWRCNAPESWRRNFMNVQKNCTWQELECQRASPPCMRPSLQTSVFSCSVSATANIWESKDREFCRFAACCCCCWWWFECGCWFVHAFGCCSCSCIWDTHDALVKGSDGEDCKELGGFFDKCNDSDIGTSCICTCGSRTCSLWSCCTTASLDCCLLTCPPPPSFPIITGPVVGTGLCGPTSPPHLPSLNRKASCHKKGNGKKPNGHQNSLCANFPLSGREDDALEQGPALKRGWCSCARNPSWENLVQERMDDFFCGGGGGGPDFQY